MKIGIVTMISENYGNRLQNYALQSFLEEIGFEVETFHNPFNPKYNDLVFRLKRILRCLYACFVKNKRIKIMREFKFNRFSRKYIIWSKYWLNKTKDRKRINSEYDYVVCGSDQIWNPESKNIDGRFFANFVDDNKRISYAASFGLDEICDRKNEWKEYLLGMNAISVREKQGIKIVKELCDKDVTQNIDPVFLISKEQWQKVEQMPNKESVKDKYILKYFLGIQDKKLSKNIEHFAIDNNLKVIEINNENFKDLYSISPQEFVYLISHAELVCTDSFHGAALSIIMNTPLIIYDRIGEKNSMNSRIVSLCDLFSIHNINYSIEQPLEIPKIDFERIEFIILNERNKAELYFKKYLV